MSTENLAFLPRIEMSGLQNLADAAHELAHYAGYDKHSYAVEITTLVTKNFPRIFKITVFPNEDAIESMSAFFDIRGTQISFTSDGQDIQAQG